MNAHTVTLITAGLTAWTALVAAAVNWWIAQRQDQRAGKELVHKEAEAIWEDAAEWRQELRGEVARLTGEVERLSSEVRSLKDENKHLAALFCLRSECERRLPPLQEVAR